MTVDDLIWELGKIDRHKIVIIGDGDGDGWANIERIDVDHFQVAIIPEKFPLFSDN
jgi:hypothetical protein